MRKRMVVVELLAAIGLAMAGCGPTQSPGQKVFATPKAPPAPPPVKAMAIDPALASAASNELDDALKSSDEIIRAHAIETIKLLNETTASPAILTALNDPSPLVRKAAALATGEMQIHGAMDRLNQRLDTAKVQERMAILFALHRLGDSSHTHEFEQTAIDPDPHIRGDTAMILGMLGEKSAVPMLLQMLNKDKIAAVRLQAAESLWKLGEERGLDELVGATISRYPDDRMIAALALAQPRDTRVLGHIEGLLIDDYQEVALVAARAAGMLGSDHGYGVAIEGAKSVDPRKRLLAALAFGAIGRNDAQPLLATLLKDTDPDVRVAAAGAEQALAAGKGG